MNCRLCCEPFMYGDAAYSLKKSVIEKHPGTGQTILKAAPHEDGSPVLYFHLHCLAERGLDLIAAEGGRIDG